MAPKRLAVDPPTDRRDALATSPHRVGFGLSGLAEYLRHPGDIQEAHLTPGDVTLVIEDGLLMALGPEGDPVAPRSFAAAADLRPDEGVVGPGGQRIPARRVAAALEAQAHHGGEIPGTPWLLAMLGIGDQPQMAPKTSLRAEQLRCDLTAIGDELLIRPTVGQVFLVTGAKWQVRADDDRAHLRIEGRAISAAALADRMRQHLLAAGGGTATTETTVSDCDVVLRDQALLICAPFADIELANGPAGDGGPAVRVFLADGRPIRPGELATALGHPARVEWRDGGPTASSLEVATEAVDPEYDTWPPSAEPRRVSAAAPTRGSAPIRLGIDPPRPPRAGGTTVVVLAGLPSGATPSAGVADGDGRWLLQVEDCRDLTLTLAEDGPDAFTFEMTAIAVLDREGSLASAREMIAVTTGAAPIPLDLSTCMADDPTRFDAVLLRDLPAGTALSTGTEDPGVRGWIVLPTQLPGLTMIPDADHSGPATVRVCGISLRPDGRANARELARLSLIMA